jgi:hypothetical protein
MSHKRFILRILLVILVIAVSGSIVAQVSNQIVRNYGEVYSPSGLQEKPATLKVGSKMSNPANNATLQEIPDDITYSQIFRHLEELNRKADEDERVQGKDGKQLRNLYKDMAKLDERQARILDNIAAKTNAETQKLDDRARQIISEIRAQTPNRTLQKGQAPPLPPQELENLSNQRTALIMQAINELKANLGESEFARFSQFVNQNVKTGIKNANGKKPN